MRIKIISVQRKMWRRMNKKNLLRENEKRLICESKRELEEILKGRLETIEEEPEEEERARKRERQRSSRESRRVMEKGKAIVKAKVKSGKMFYMLCVSCLASKHGFTDLVLH